MSEKIIRDISEITDVNIENYVKKAKDLTSETLDKYQRLMDSDVSFSYVFQMGTRNEKLYSYENDVKIVLTRKRLDTENEFKIKGMPKHSIDDIEGAAINVKVSSIDRENKLVALKTDVEMLSKKHSDRDKLIKALQDGIAKGEFIRVPATVIRFTGENKDTGVKNNSMAILDIANLGIFGICRVFEWSVDYIASFTHTVNIGDTVEVLVRKVSNWSSGSCFECSRKALMIRDNINPWKGLEEKLPKNTNVCVKCIAKTEDCWYGMIEGIPDVTVICNYPDKKLDILIEEGKKYRGFIYKINESKRTARVYFKDKIE